MSFGQNLVDRYPVDKVNKALHHCLSRFLEHIPLCENKDIVLKFFFLQIN